MSDEAVPQSPVPQSPGRFERPRKLFASAFRGIHGLGSRLADFSRYIGASLSRSIRWMGWRSLQQLGGLFERHHSSRQVTQKAVQGSAVTTGLIPVDASRTSAGASNNLEEILRIIDDSLQAGISEGVWAGVTDGLEEVAEATENSKLPEDARDCNFFRDIPHSAQLIQLAAQCSKMAYKHTSTASDERPTADSAGSSLSVVDIATELSKASRDGMIKACVITSRKRGDDQLLVVAIRGTVSLVDWLVNLDGDLDPTGDFLVYFPNICFFDAVGIDQLGQKVECDEPVKAHAGLLRVAKGMLPAICSKIRSTRQALTTTAPDLEISPELLFTGHSAGGGVAALICAHVRSHCPDIVQGFGKIHCVTFAAPPVLAPLHAVSADYLNRAESMTINMVNHGDLVPRAEKSYIRSLLKLYAERAEHPSEERWDFGQPTTFNYGHIFVLQDISDSEDDAPQVHAYRPSQDLWQTLAFGSVKAHPMTVYLTAVEDFVTLHRP